ncbi:MAG: thiamine diphosphokinase [Proteobacteria bacterium]|nr:thiamine diphosphokinase [Pseudomonadota bacterium]
MGKQKGLILLNGNTVSRELLSRQISQADLVISADGAAKVFMEYHYFPDVILGDLDSIGKPELDFFSERSTIVKIEDQNSTDGEKAIQYCHNQGISDIAIMGALGKRLDHELYNIGLLRYKPSLNIILIYEFGRVMLLRDRLILREQLNTTISLIPVFGPVEGVRSTGLAYPLDSVDMELGVFGSISNETVENQVEITIESGLLLVCINDKHTN